MQKSTGRVKTNLAQAHCISYALRISAYGDHGEDANQNQGGEVQSPSHSTVASTGNVVQGDARPVR